MSLITKIGKPWWMGLWRCESCLTEFTLKQGDRHVIEHKNDDYDYYDAQFDTLRTIMGDVFGECPGCEETTQFVMLKYAFGDHPDYEWSDSSQSY